MNAADSGLYEAVVELLASIYSTGPKGESKMHLLSCREQVLSKSSQFVGEGEIHLSFRKY